MGFFRLPLKTSPGLSTDNTYMGSEATLSFAGELKAGVAAVAFLGEQADLPHEFPGVPVVKSSRTIVKIKSFVKIKIYHIQASQIHKNTC